MGNSERNTALGISSSTAIDIPANVSQADLGRAIEVLFRIKIRQNETSEPIIPLQKVTSGPPRVMIRLLQFEPT